MTKPAKDLSPMRRRAVDRLLVQLLELPEREQAAWLKETRARFPRLGRWLAMLAEDSHTITFLDDSVRRLAGETVQHMETSAKRLSPGSRLGPWEVQAEIGQGGMGRVYRGRRADGAFEMEVAIKLIGQRRRGLAELLQRECQLLARLDHPSVTRLVDAGLDDQAGPFLVMEWVEGTDLADWLKREQPDQEAGLLLFRGIAEAVAHAHQRLIVHGDIKPNNIRIRDDGTVKLMDFGVARLLDASDPDDAGLRAMTPAFAAPEQRQGEDITPASDIWSLGAMLRWLIEAGPSDQASRRTRLQDRELDAIINKAQAEQPANRYRSVDEFLSDLERSKRHQDVSALPSTAANRLRKFVRRNPVLVGGVLTTFIALGIGLVAAAWMYLQADVARHAAELAQEQAEINAREADQIADFQARQMGSINIPGLALNLREELIQAGFSPPTDDSNVDLTRVLIGLVNDHLLEVTIDATDAHFADQPLVKVRLLQSLAGSQRALGLYDRAARTLALADELIEDHAPVDHPVRLTAAHQQALLKSELGQLEEALSWAEEAYAQRQRVLGEHHRDTLTAGRELARQLQNLGRHDEARQLYQLTLEGRRQTLGERHPDTLTSRLDLGTFHLIRNELDQAEPWLVDVASDFSDVLGEDHLETVGVKANLAVLYRRQGRVAEAKQLNRDILQAYTSLLGPGHPNSLRSLLNLGVISQVEGDFGGAAEYFQQAFEGYRSLYGSLHPQTLAARSNLGTVLVQIGEYDQAERHLQATVNGRREVLGDEHQMTLVTMTSLAGLMIRREQAAEALALTDHVYRSFSEVMGESNPTTLVAMSLWGAALRISGQLPEALAATMRSVELGREVLPEGHWRLASLQMQLARVQKDKGQTEQAIDTARHAHELASAGLSETHPLVQELVADLAAWSDTK